jgi:ABC-type branched-subunit amino acid transport system substrate-binding protein
MSSPFSMRRRLLLAGAAAWPLASRATGAVARPVKVVQLLDSSLYQRELSRDHAAGVQVAMAEYNRSTAGIARPVRLQQIEVAGEPELAREIASLRSDLGVCALLGSVGEALSLRSVPLARQEKLGLVHVAPWLADDRFDADEDVVPLFASRDMQVQHAMAQLQGIGIQEVGVVFGTPGDEALLGHAVAEVARKLAVKMRVLGALDSASLNQQLSPGGGAPAVLLFVGATVELARLTQTLAQRKLQRYVVSLADVDVSTLLQLGSGRTVPLIVTQVVPNPNTSSLGVVRSYRQQLKLLFDEAPTPVSLAGYLAARYFTQVLGRVEGAVTRASLLQAFGKRPPAELDGFEVRFNGTASRGSRFVTQTMLTPDGRLVG